jgi:hypothetical protein
MIISSYFTLVTLWILKEPAVVCINKAVLEAGRDGKITWGSSQLYGIPDKMRGDVNKVE